LVNRDPSYLQKAARSLSKEYQLEDAVVGLYKNDTSFKPSVLQKKVTGKKSHRKRSKKSLRQLTLTREFGGEAQDIAHEMSFAWPMEKKLFWLSYGFGPRKHPSGRWEYHRGIDLAAPTGTPVAAAASGVVVQACYSGGYGNTVVIAHNKKFATRYAHLSKILVSVGDELAQGDILGKVGATGNVRGKNGSHLHFEIMVYGKRVNPFYFLS
jgi:murein DD-endopeptidase MepM/ murein hydrolase activator NlpD